MMSGCLLVAGCSATAEPEVGKQPGAAVTRVQELGESTRTVWVRGEGAGLIPSYSERVGAFVFNRVRTAPHHLGLTDMEGNPILPNTPAQFQAYMAEAGRWQAQHNLETGCNCDAAAVGYNPMDPATRPNEKYVGATCCKMGIKEGVPACVGPLVGCKDPEATLRTERWKLLNPGPAQILQEQGQVAMSPLLDSTSFAGFVLENALGVATSGNVQAFALTQAALTVVPEACQKEEEPANSCPVGRCTEPGSGSRYCTKDANPDCIGVCEGAPQQVFCVLPEKVVKPECMPENFRKDLYLGVLTGITAEPIPALTDGIHHQLNFPLVQGMPMDDMQTVLGIVPRGQLSYAVHYYERNGQPEGTPQSIKVVVDDQCTDLTKLATQTNLPNTNPPVAAPFRGATYKTTLPATPGCHKYVFVARDGDGFEYTYPEYGSLQALINSNGLVAENDDTCPIWTEVRVDLACAGAGATARRTTASARPGRRAASTAAGQVRVWARSSRSRRSATTARTTTAMAVWMKAARWCWNRRWSQRLSRTWAAVSRTWAVASRTWAVASRTWRRHPRGLRMTGAAQWAVTVRRAAGGCWGCWGCWASAGAGGAER
jgi:hypothetical protein